MEPYLHAPNGDRKLTQKSRRTQQIRDPDFLEDSHTSKLLPLIRFSPQIPLEFEKSNMIYQARRQLA